MAKVNPWRYLSRQADKLEKQVPIFDQHPEVGLVTGNIEFVKKNGIRTGRVITQTNNHGTAGTALSQCHALPRSLMITKSPNSSPIQIRLDSS